MSQVEEISDELAKITVKQPMQGDVNVYVFRKERVTIIDCGHPSPDTQAELLSGLNQLGLKPEDIDQVVLTHRHIDHVGGIVCQYDNFDRAKVIALAGPSEPIIQLDALERVKSYIPQQHVNEIIDDALYDAFRSYYSFAKPLRVDSRVREGDKIDIGGEQLTVIETPGHCIDHISLLHEKSGSLIGGDVLLPQGPPMIQSLDSYMKSMEKIRSCGAKVVHPGHGKEIHDIHEAVSLTVNRLAATDQKILDALKRNINTPFSLALEFTGGKTHRGIRFFLEVVLTHLERMNANNEIELIYDNDKIDHVLYRL
ncbi:MAG: fold metallo-hydrolase [Paenibacillus sp.]|nr:fold metallo-hydrolase [Paenibacillus sp.]